MCPFGMQYMACGPVCEETCENIGTTKPDYCKTDHCVEGCYCPPGQYLEGIIS